MRSKTNLPIPYRFNHIAHKWGKTDFPLPIVLQYNFKPSDWLDGLYQKGLPLMPRPSHTNNTTMQQGLKGKRKDSVLGGLSAQNASFAR